MVATKEQIKELFGLYDLADKEVDRIKKELEGALSSRSDKVKAIFEATGSKGPYNFKGSQVKIVQRNQTFFFRGKSADGVIDVE